MNGVRERTERERVVEQALRRHYFRSMPDGYLETEWGRSDLEHHVTGRLHLDRTIVVPWLGGIRELAGARVLEIGCGTGSSTVALAERGADVVALDVDEASLAVARERCRQHGVDVRFVEGNAAALPPDVRDEKFDLIIFYASLEHMTLDERLAAIAQTWDMLPGGGLWSMIDTPNRLWYFDFHTSLLPFFQWLPDELAFAYSRFSDRPRFNDLYREPDADSVLHFLRRGRGVSFHELELVMGRVSTLRIAGWLDWEKQTKSWLERLRGLSSVDRRYRRFLRQAVPAVPEAFLQPRLDVVIRKGE
jgi:ubiquinone/menaquinone biosynthesis C-methylase UbiE